MINDETIDAKTRQGWFKRYTDANRALIQTLKAREEKDWEKKVEQIREFRRRAVMQLESESSGAGETGQAKQQEQV